jgi:polyhydroxyalkanoate synthesis regulator phasin
MLEDVRKNVRGFVEAGVAAVSGALTPSRARDLAHSMTGGEGREQVNRVAQELLEWSQRSREFVAELVQREVKRQLAGVGIATREDIDALRKRVRELERSSGSSAKASAKASSKRSSAKGSVGKGATKKASSTAKPVSPETAPTEPSAATGLGDPGTGSL